MVLTQSVVLQNPIHFATGALSTFVYALTGSAAYTIERPKGYKVIGISASFADDDNVEAKYVIVTDVANIKVLVYDGTPPTAIIENTDAFAITAVVFAMKSGV